MKKMTPRARLLDYVAQEIARANYNRWRMVVKGDPTPETQKFLAIARKHGAKNIDLPRYTVDNIYPRRFADNSVQGLVESAIRTNSTLPDECRLYYIRATDKAFYRFALEALRLADKIVSRRADYYEHMGRYEARNAEEETAILLALNGYRYMMFDRVFSAHKNAETFMPLGSVDGIEISLDTIQALVNRRVFEVVGERGAEPVMGISQEFLAYRELKANIDKLQQR